MKSTILASRRDDKRLKIEFVKNQAFVTLLHKILKKYDLKWGIFQDQGEAEVIVEKIGDFKDKLFHFECNQAKIDIYVGTDKIIFVLYSANKLQQQIMDEFINNSKWKQK